MGKIITNGIGKTLFTKKQKQNTRRNSITLEGGNKFWIYDMDKKKMWIMPLSFNVMADGSAVCKFKPEKKQLICVAPNPEKAEIKFIDLITKMKIKNGKATK